MSAVLLGVILTFLGTAGTGYAGFVKWRSDQARDKARDYRENRVSTLKSVWENLTLFEQSQRESITQPAPSETNPRLIEVNALMLRSSPFLLRDEQQWAATYVVHLLEIDTLLRASPRREADSEWWARTDRAPAGTNVAAQAAHRLREVADKLAERYAAVVRGDHE